MDGQGQGRSEARPLPRGRHRLSRDEVRASQQRRLLDAMVASVGEAGYAKSSVSDVLERARVSRATFYEHFANKEECFLAACDAVQDALFHAVLTAAQPGGDWKQALRRGTRAALEFWAANPAAASLYLLEVHAAGPRALAHRDRLHTRFEAVYAEVLRIARAEEPGRPDRPPVVVTALVHALAALCSSYVRQGRLQAVDAAEAELLYVQLAALADHETAARVAVVPVQRR